MKITITRMFYTEHEVEIPDDKAHDKNYLAEVADDKVVDAGIAEWSGTMINVTETDEELASW